MGKEQEIREQGQVKHSLESVIKPWSKIPPDQLLDSLNGMGLSIKEISRDAGLSPEHVLKNLPIEIKINGTNLQAEKGINMGTLPVKKMIRESVKEPPIKGVRNGRKRFRRIIFQRKSAIAQKEGQQIIFKSIDKDAKVKARAKRRNRIHDIVANRRKRDQQKQSDQPIIIDQTNPLLRTLQSLVNISPNDIATIAQNAVNDPEIHLFDFKDMLGLQDKNSDELNENAQLLEATQPPARLLKKQALNDIIDALPTMHPLSKARIHPLTSLESGVPLFFGMGGGSRMPCQGLPFDVLKMVLTGEKIRRELGLSQCFVLGADEITYTNIGKTPEFTKDKVDNIIGAEIALLNEFFGRFGLKHWQAIKQSQLAQHFSPNKVAEWRTNIEQADKVSFVGGHHYAIEMADIQLFVPNGIKLGWWTRPLTVGTGYIMDEQPFHARFSLLKAFLGKPHATTLLYTHAGARLLLGKDGLIEKEAPYITYTPEKRLLLSPFEQVERKLAWAEFRGGGLLPFIKEQMEATIALFEELIAPLSVCANTERDLLAKKLQFIITKGVGNDSKLEEMWQKAFPNSS